MAILYDDFQSYAVGNTGPYGILTSFGTTHVISNTAQSDGTTGAYGKSKYFTCLLGGINFNDGASRANGSFMFAFRRRPGSAFFNGTLCTVKNQAGVAIHRLFDLVCNADGTLSAQSNNTQLGPPLNFVFSTDQWNFFQINVTLANIAGNLNLVWEVAIDGLSVGSGTMLFGAVAGLPNPTATWQQVLFQTGSMGADFGELTIDTIQSVPTFPNPGTSLGRSTNQIIELMLVPGSAPPLALSCPAGTGIKGNPYSSFAVASGGTPPYTFAITVGSLPPGLLLNAATGQVTGTPTTNGTYPYTIQVTDSLGATKSSSCQIVISTVSIPTLACPLGIATVGTAYDSFAVVTGGTPPYTFSIISGALPPGLVLNLITGEITGTPTTSGVYVYTIKVVDSLGAFATSNCQIIVASIFPPPVPIDQSTCKERNPPLLYGWEPSYLERPEDIAMRASDWEDAGLVGAKFLQGFTLQADTQGADKILKIQGDGSDIQTYTINHDGEQIKPYVFNPASIASLMRFISPDVVPWRFFGIRYIWEPLPELVTYYQTQGTTHDIPGYQFLKDGYISLISTDTVTLVVNVDGVDYTYTIPTTSGAHRKTYMIFGINGTTGRTLKGKIYTYTLSSPAGFRLFQKDCEVRVHAWSGGDYVVKQPFGDSSRIYGARI